uniref:ETS domain-containing protein n=1 Tax=Bursaphelenchus xylophilus TaxID=6326 RepID=A0A1I7RVG9_BURXY
MYRAFDSYQSQSQPLPCPPSVNSQHLQPRSNLMSSSSSSSASVLGWDSSSASESPSAPATAQDFLTGFNPDSNHPYYNERYSEFSMVKSQYYESNPMPSGHGEQEIFSPCQSVSSSSSITDDENMQDPQQFDQHDMQGQLQMPPPQMMVCQQQCSQPFYPQYVHQQSSHFQQQKPNYVHQQQMPIPVQPDFHCRPGMSQMNNGGRTVHLWHFIKELLENPKEYSGCVRWVDREDGTFKIESSLQLARYWGIRKNRSQMNYDKLSRSLRQYYKKGIIQKPEKKQRLVYKFLPPYNHPQVN